MSPALLRIVYASQALEPADAPGLAADVRDILAVARVHNRARGISGLLIVANGHFLQVLEGPHADVDALYGCIGRDRRHQDVSLLSRVDVEARCFGDWSMGFVERSEPEAATTARLQLLRNRLAHDPEVSAADFCRLILAPSVNPVPLARLKTRSWRAPTASVAFVSPTGMWSAAVLQHLSSTAMLRTGRTAVTDPEDAAHRTLIEYIDFETPDIGPVRALSLAAEPAAFASVAPLMERLSLLVFTMTASDADAFTAYVKAWLSTPQVAAAAPEILVLGGLAQERVVPVLEALRAETALTIGFASVKLSDSAAVWQAAQWPLRRQVAIRRAGAGRPGRSGFMRFEETAVGEAEKSAPTPTPTPIPLQAEHPTTIDPPPAEAAAPRASNPLPAPAPAGSPTSFVSVISDAGCLDELLGVEGALGAALIDASQRRVLLTLDPPGMPPRSFVEDAQFLQLKWQLAKSLGIDAPIEDIAVTTSRELMIYRALPRHPELFLALTLDRRQAQLAAARLRLQDITEALALLPI